MSTGLSTRGIPYNAPIHIIPVGGGAGKGCGLVQKVEIPVKFLRVEKSLFVQIYLIKTTLGQKLKIDITFPRSRLSREEDILVYLSLY